jgi:ATP-dependent Lon protease
VELVGDGAAPASPREEALLRHTRDLFERHAKLNDKLPPEAALSVLAVPELGRAADLMATQATLKTASKQALLEAADPCDRLELLGQNLAAENEILEIEKRIHGRVRRGMEKVQREAYLREQMKVIQRELGQKDEPVGEAVELKQRLESRHLPKEAHEKALKELERFDRMAPYSAEATVVRTYLDWLLSLPWGRRSQDREDLERAEAILEEDHHGLEKPKQRVLEFLAVRHLLGRGRAAKGPILCLVGPPGVGKTSLAKSIARSLGREYQRISLGGVRDEAEIRGHRRTYIGAMPGRIIQGLRRAKRCNPVLLLDEIDKMAADFRGDPAAALLEVLDPEQNRAFTDHYLDVEFDLSEVLFIATANGLHNIPAPLRDRMEVIEIGGYTDEEKLAIAQRFLLPKQLKAHGLKPGQLELGADGLRRLLRGYTREAGVRGLEREITALCRKAAREVVKGGPKAKVLATPAALARLLGAPTFNREDEVVANGEGLATGLAWTEAGGEVLAIEAALFKGKGALTLTGKLGEVMKESAQAALGYIRSRAQSLGISEDFHKAMDIHLHIPEGATPKDGPSAGITMAVALASALAHRSVRPGLVMTGEITLRGRVLAVGGIKEKVLAAHRAGAKVLLLPRANRRDLEEVPADVRRALQIYLVSGMDQVLKLALEPRKRRVAKSSKIPAPAEAETWKEGGLLQ